MKREASQTFRDEALRFPETEEGIACAGTSLEKRTIKVRNKAFLFLGAADAMLKLRESLPQAAKLAANEPGRYAVGANGWVKVTFADATNLPIDVLVNWIGESYKLMAPKQAGAAAPARTGKKAARPRRARDSKADAKQRKK
jgi:hypothetical protein